jgi:hypothetical protein
VGLEHLDSIGEHSPNALGDQVTLEGGSGLGHRRTPCFERSTVPRAALIHALAAASRH